MSELPFLSPQITRHRLRLSAGELDDPLARFTEPVYRKDLQSHLFLLSLRSLEVDLSDTFDGVSASKRKKDQVIGHVNRYNNGAQYFNVGENFRYFSERTDTTRIVGIDLAVHFGVQSLTNLLRPDLYLSDIPPDELGTDIVWFRYKIPHPVVNANRQLDYLHTMIEQGARVHDINLVDMVKPGFPLSIAIEPPRSEKLLKGEESYVIQLRPKKTPDSSDDDILPLEGVG